MSPKELNSILAAHEQWLQSEGSAGNQANFLRGDLSGADLNGVDLRRARLSYARLSGACLRNARLAGALLNDIPDADGADFRGADMSGANLSRSNLSNADLRGACLIHADLPRVNLTGALIDDIDWGFDLPEAMPDLKSQLARQIALAPDRLDMSDWHGETESCETTHCLAGWAVTLHPRGKELEALAGTSVAATLIWIAAGEAEVRSLFYSDTATARRWITDRD